MRHYNQEGSTMRQRVTKSGLTFTVAILIVGLAAFASANNLLFLLLAAMLSAFLISGLISRLGLSGLELELSLPDHLVAKEPASGTLALYNTKRWMSSFSIRLSGTPGLGLLSPLYFPLVPAGERIRERGTFQFPRRGLYNESAFQVASRFPFGFTERQIPVTVRQNLLVYPSLSPPPPLEQWLQALTRDVAASRRGRGAEFHHLRSYETSESARLIDWKSSARTGQLHVREFADEQDRHLVLSLDLHVPPAGEEWFERAIECCAYLAVHVPQHGGRVQLQTQQSFAGDTDTILKVLALVQPLPGATAQLPHDPNAQSVLFTARPSAFLDAGWADALVLDPGSLSALAADTDASASGPAASGPENQHHGRG